MSDVERETYLHGIRTEAWDAFMKAYSSTGDSGQIYAAAAEVYERELRAQLDTKVTSDRDYTESLRSLTRIRKTVQQMIDGVTYGTTDLALVHRTDLDAVLGDVSAVLGPDLLREADSTGEILKELPFEQRKAMLDAIDGGPKAIEGSDGREQLRRFDRDAIAERLSDYLTQLGVDPDETFEGDPRTTAQILADVTLSGEPTSIEVGSPDHQAIERMVVAQMAAEDVARGEG